MPYAVKDNGSLLKGDDSIVETKHKYKRDQKKRVFTQGARMVGEYWKVKVAVPKHDAMTGEIVPNKFETRTYKKKANIPDFEAVQRREAIMQKRSFELMPKLITSSRAQHMKSEKGAARDEAQGVSRELMLALKPPAAASSSSSRA